MAWQGMLGSIMGGSGSGSGMSGMGQGMMAYGLQKHDQDVYNRQVLFNNLMQAMDQRQWLMNHFPNFWGSPAVNPEAAYPAQNYAMSNAAIQSAFQQQKQGSDMAAQSRTLDIADKKATYEKQYYDWVIKQNTGGGQSQSNGWNRTPSGLGYRILP